MEKITIITVTYNCQDIIEETINSIIYQTYNNIEYIIVDGNSKDATLDIIKKYESKIDKIISEPDNGIFDAMNKGIDIASGDWIIFMNAGDRFDTSNVLKNIFSKENTAEYDVIHGLYKVQKKGIIYKPRLIPFYKLTGRMRGMGFSHQSVFVRTLLAKQNKFDLRYKLSADFNQIYKLYYNCKARFKEVDIVVSVMEGDDSFTSRNYKKHLKEVMDICKDASSFEKYNFYHKRLFKHRLKIVLNKIRELFK